MRLAKSVLLAASILSASAFAARADVSVVASIKPVHSLVAAVMEGVGEPGLIVEGAGSPHTYALRPSQARRLENADLVFWVGHELEAFLEKPLEAIATRARIVELINAHGLIRLAFREGGAFDEHGHDEHGHDERGHEQHVEHGHEEHADGAFDPHVWLDPVNAKILVHEIEKALAEADPENADRYEANARNVIARLDDLVGDVSAELASVKGKPFVVFHDAYRHFEARFGLTTAGSVTVSPEVLPGAERVRELRDKVRGLNATCVFAEPQFEPRMVSTITEGTSAKTGVLDPLGASIADGPELYFTLIRNMADAFRACLSEAS
ncbi:MAG: zinc ABC transporter substrate-binding protein ZnuA [Rhodospirillales bacterium]